MLNILDDGSAPAFVNHAQGMRYARMFQSYPTIRICRDLIREYVFERPLIGPDELDQAQWRQLGMEMFDQVMIYGFAIVRAKPGTAPSVVPWDMCRVSIAVDQDFHRVMTVYPARMHDGQPDAPLTHVYVLDMFGFTPSLDGDIQSLMRPLAYKIDMIRDQIDCTLAADRARARPPCFAETHDDATAPNQEVTYDYYADAAGVQSNAMNTYMRNQSALEQLEAQQEKLRAGSSRSDGTASEQVASHNVSTAVKNAIDSITPMPIGQRVARGPECHAPDALVDRMRFIEQEIFVLLGVPRSFCMHDITVRHDAGMLHCTMTRTMHRWQNTLGEAMSFVWNVTHNGPPAKRRKRINIAKAAEERSATIRFEHMPRVSVNELSHAYYAGVISWDAYQRQIATFCGMATEDLLPSGDPWSREERLQLMGVKSISTEFTKSSTGAGL